MDLAYIESSESASGPVPHEISGLAMRELNGPTEIVTVLKHDNNHVLNTFFLWLLDGRAPIAFFRLLSWFSGTLCVVASSLFAQRHWGRVAGFWASLLAGFSFPLIAYFSEARGYGPAMGAGVGALYLLDRYLERGRWPVGLAYVVVCCLGVLSHSTFLFVLPALGLWELARRVQNGLSFWQAAFRSLATQLVPLAVAVTWTITFVRVMEIGGGPQLPRDLVVANASAYLLGPSLFLTTYPLAALVSFAVLIILTIASLCRSGDRLWVFGVALLAAPLVAILLTQPSHLFFRYFLVLMPLLYLLYVGAAADWAGEQAQRKRLVTLVLFGVLLVGHAPSTFALVRDGRGHYLSALQAIAATSSDAPARVGSNRDFLASTVFEFYHAAAGGDEKLIYVMEADRPVKGMDWYIFQLHGSKGSAPDTLMNDDLGLYQKEGRFPAALPSGFTWYLYRKVDSPQ